jgi:hypothetical protein
MPTIVEGVDFDTIAREWRCKWDGADESKASLAAAQALIATHLATIKAVPGVTSVQRFVCGGCFDFKIVTSVAEPSYGAWAGADHSPEKEVSFLYRNDWILGSTTLTMHRAPSLDSLSLSLSLSLLLFFYPVPRGAHRY